MHYACAGPTGVMIGLTYMMHKITGLDKGYDTGIGSVVLQVINTAMVQIIAWSNTVNFGVQISNFHAK